MKCQRCHQELPYNYEIMKKFRSLKKRHKTLRAKKKRGEPYGRPQKCDGKVAKRLRDAGLSYNEISKRMNGVSTGAIRYQIAKESK